MEILGMAKIPTNSNLLETALRHTNLSGDASSFSFTATKKNERQFTIYELTPDAR